MTTATFNLAGLGSRKLSALKRKAKSLGLTPDDYVQQLVEEALELESEAMKMSWQELTAPIRKALGPMSDAEIDSFVDRARGSKGKRGTK